MIDVASGNGYFNRHSPGRPPTAAWARPAALSSLRSLLWQDIFNVHFARVVWHRYDQERWTISGNFINALKQRHKERKDQKESTRNGSKGLPCWIFRRDEPSFSILSQQTVQLVEYMDWHLQPLECHMHHRNGFVPLGKNWFSIFIHTSPTSHQTEPNQRKLKWGKMSQKSWKFEIYKCDYLI